MNHELKNLRVLVIEDEAEIREFLTGLLAESGIVVMSLPSGEGVQKALDDFNPEVILLDQIMPGKTGREVVREVRANLKFAEIPIMMLTGLDGESDKVDMLAEGVDDYVTKPFSIKEVIARINALIRRSKAAHKSTQKNIVIKDLTVDLVAHRVLLREREIQLTLTEFKILVELLRQCGQVLSRDKLREQALGNFNVTDRTIDVHMASLRKKLEHIGELIETVRGVGYKIDPQA